MTQKYKIIFNRDECIGCSACAAVNPQNWEMKEDGKSHLKESTLEENEQEISELEENYDDNLEAAESCPVNCIHIYVNDEKKV